MPAISRLALVLTLAVLGLPAAAAPGDTLATVRSAAGAVKVVEVAVGLETPWSLAFLPDGRMLVTERPGRLRIVRGGGDLDTHQAGAAVAIDQHHRGLDVAMRQAGLVRESQSVEHLHAPTRGVESRHTLRGGDLGQRAAITLFVGHIGPAVVLTDLDRHREARMRHARRLAQDLQVALQRSRTGRLRPRHDQHAFGIDAWIVRQPHQRLRALAEQPQQLERPKRRRCRRLGGRSLRLRVGLGRWHRTQERQVARPHRSLLHAIEPNARTARSVKVGGKRRVIRTRRRLPAPTRARPHRR